MNRIFFAFFAVFFIFSTQLLGGERPKIVYLKLVSPTKDNMKTLYVGQNLKVTYNLLLFSGATLLDMEINTDTSRLDLLNQDSKWKKLPDGSYENTFVYKIKKPYFNIPSLNITAISKDGDYTDIASVADIPQEAVELGGDNYCGVVANSLDFKNPKAKKYDDKSNIVVFDLVSSGGNLEDFSIKNTEKQGFDGNIQSTQATQNGIYYLIVPNDVSEIKFTYFSLSLLKYVENIIPIIVENDKVSTQSDIEPKNNFLILSNILLFLLLIALVFCIVFSKKYKKLFIVAVVLVVFYLFYVFLFPHTAIIKSGTIITILPSSNSTVLENVGSDIEVSIIGQYGGYYKVALYGEKVGWVKKIDTK